MRTRSWGFLGFFRRRLDMNWCRRANPFGRKQLPQNAAKAVSLLPVFAGKPTTPIQRSRDVESHSAQMFNTATVRVHRQRQAGGDEVNCLGRRFVRGAEVGTL